MSLTPEAKKLLAETIRGSQQDPGKGLREKLLRAIHDEADRRYRLSVSIADAGLDEAHRRRRERIEAWVDERARSAKTKNKTELKSAKERLLAQAEKEAAATLLNRLVLLRHLEALGLSKPAVLTGGWNSKGYREFREFAPTLCSNGTADATEGYATLLQLVFDELAIDLPGLFGNVGLTRLFPIPAATLREVVERLDNADLSSAWTDDTTLGWVYQYWNDPDREALDAKINGGGKIEPHEIASKTQMFTERYMVEWLLQNSLGLTWLCLCKKQGWRADVTSSQPVSDTSPLPSRTSPPGPLSIHGEGEDKEGLPSCPSPAMERGWGEVSPTSVLGRLEARRVEWRNKRDAGEVALDALMPIDGEQEDHWKYYVPQPLPEDAVAKAPESVRAIKLLDPACGSGHFLVIAFGLLTALYREEARHLGQSISDKEVAESILEHNLYGIDIDPRAIQIAAAGLYLKAKSLAKAARPKQVNLVAPVLQLGNLPSDDPAVVHLRDDLKREAGIPEELTNKLLTSLAGVDYLGSLLKVDAAVEEALRSVELEFERVHGQGDLFGGFPAQQVKLSMGEAKATILDRLERFLAKHSKSEDLGLRLDGEQLAAGVRFVRMAKEGAYDVVVGNPPYQGLSKTQAFEYVAKTYPRGKADLYAAFLERSLQLVREGGLSALLTMRGWMFLGQFAELRQHVLRTFDLRCVGDFDRGAFDEVPNEVLAVSAPIICRCTHGEDLSVAVQPTPLADKSYDRERTKRKRAAVLAHVGRYEFDPRGFAVIEGEPVVYWWSKEFLARYAAAPKLGPLYPVRTGVCTSDNTRFLRKTWEIEIGSLCDREIDSQWRKWATFVSGAKGVGWFDTGDDICLWFLNGLEMKVYNGHLYGSYSRTIQNEAFYFRPGIAFTMIGSAFAARAHRTLSIMGKKGSSVFPDNVPETLCSMNTTLARDILQSINPGIGFEVGDVNRLPLLRVESSSDIHSTLERAIAEHDTARETSIGYVTPGLSSWRYAQSWAQKAVDRPEGAPLPPYEPDFEPAASEDFISFAAGIALGRFDAGGGGALDAARTSPLTPLHSWRGEHEGEGRADSFSLPSPPSGEGPGVRPLDAGILFISCEASDSLEHQSCAQLHNEWKTHGPVLTERGQGEDLRTYLRKSFFTEHKKRYESRPIYFPLSSAKKSFVAFISIHRWQDDTLNVLLADHLVPTKRRLDGELDDLRTARASGSNKGKAEKRFTEVQKLLEELNDFISKVTEVAEKGSPPPDDKTTKREVDARYVMDLDDGVMVNSAALWPLLEPQWKDPKKWWKELANAQGKKDYDWAHLSARYFPTRVRAKCHDDPSLAVAHKCFWELHPAKAYAWELRLQDEIRPEFTIDESGSDAARAKFLAGHAEQAKDILAKEVKRREKKAAKGEQESEDGPLFEQGDDEGEEDADE